MLTAKKTALAAALLVCGLGAAGAAQAMGTPVVDTFGNNFTMIDGSGGMVGGTNDVHFTWDGTLNTAVAGAVSNATLTSPTPFFGQVWTAHDVTLYAAGTYTVNANCPAGDAGCVAGALGPKYTFTVAAGEIGAHMLFNWGTSSDIDVVDIWQANAVFGPSPMWTSGTGSNPASTVWDHMSKDWNADGKNGAGMIDGPFQGFNANFNTMGNPVPVPAAVWLFGSGLLGLVGIARRKKA